MTYILYNPLAGMGHRQEEIEALAAGYEQASLTDMTQISDYAAFFETVGEEDTVILCGGDGTVSRFVNDTRGLRLPKRLGYYPNGSGNDFARDLGVTETGKVIDLSEEMFRGLPTVAVNGKELLFINGIGYGIDGYCCEKGDELREKNATLADPKPINYTSIAVKGLLFDYRPRNVTVTVDGKVHTFKNVWLAPVMHGRYYGGGMMPTPAQDRFSEPRKLSVMVFHDIGKFRTLMIFPSLFEGKHIAHDKVVTILEGQTITVAYDRPAPMQIDGETVKNVASFTATAAKTGDGTVEKTKERDTLGV